MTRQTLHLPLSRNHSEGELVSQLVAMENKSGSELNEQDTSFIRRTNLRRMRGSRSVVAIEREKKRRPVPSPQSPPKEGSGIPAEMTTPLCWGEDNPASDADIATPAATQRENSRRLLQMLLADPDGSPIRKHFDMERRDMTDTPVSKARWADIHAFVRPRRGAPNRVLKMLEAVTDEFPPQPSPLSPPLSPVSPIANCSPDL